jgi:hypothetical protein
MVRDDRASNLMFLLSLPLLAAACPGGGEGEESTNNTSVDPTTDADTGPGETSTSNGNGATNTSNGSAETGTSETPVETGTSETPVDTGDNTTGEDDCGDLPPLMGPISQACIDRVIKNNECYGGPPSDCVMLSAAYCQFHIEQYAMLYGEACGVAFEEFYACLSMLTCEELDDPTPRACAEQFMALEMSCVAG